MIPKPNSPEELLHHMKQNVEYGWRGNDSKIRKGDVDDEEFSKHYRLQTPRETHKSGVGVCWDQVELQRHHFERMGIPHKTFFAAMDKGPGNKPSHTFLAYKNGDNWSHFENSDSENRGIHHHKDLPTLLHSFKSKFQERHGDGEFFLKEYKKPKPGIGLHDFYKHVGLPMNENRKFDYLLQSIVEGSDPNKIAEQLVESRHKHSLSGRRKKIMRQALVTTDAALLHKKGKGAAKDALRKLSKRDSVLSKMAVQGSVQKDIASLQNPSPGEGHGPTSIDNMLFQAKYQGGKKGFEAASQAVIDLVKARMKSGDPSAQGINSSAKTFLTRVGGVSASKANQVIRAGE